MLNNDAVRASNVVLRKYATSHLTDTTCLTLSCIEVMEAVVDSFKAINGNVQPQSSLTRKLAEHSPQVGHVANQSGVGVRVDSFPSNQLDGFELCLCWHVLSYRGGSKGRLGCNKI